MRATAFDVMAKRTEERRLRWRESPMREWGGRASLQLSPGDGGRADPLLRTTIAHSVTTKLAPFSQHKTGKTVERERKSTPFARSTQSLQRKYFGVRFTSSRKSLIRYDFLSGFFSARGNSLQMVRRSEEACSAGATFDANARESSVLAQSPIDSAGD